MNPGTASPDLVARLSMSERALLQRKGVRIRVDKISSDGRSALCTVCQVRRRLFQPVHTSEELVTLAHGVLNPMYQLGLEPFVSPLPREGASTFAALDEGDPFGLCSALREAGREDLLALAEIVPPFVR